MPVSRVDFEARIDDLMRRLLDAGDDRQLIWSRCMGEIHSLNASYDMTTVRRIMVDYRAVARVRLGVDHFALRFLKAFRRDDAAITAEMQARTAERLRNLRPIDPDRLLECADELLRSHRWDELAGGVAIVTGRRLPEIAAHGTFVIDDDRRLVFAGAVRGDRDAAHPVYPLVDPNDVVAAVDVLRQLKPLHDQAPADITSSYGTPVTEAIDRALGERFTPKELRDVYATIAHAFYGTPAESHRLFVARALGYNADDPTTALGHIRFFIDGREAQSCEDFERDRLELVAVTRDKLNRPDWSATSRARIQAQLEHLQTVTFDARIPA